MTEHRTVAPETKLGESERKRLLAFLEEQGDVIDVEVDAHDPDVVMVYLPAHEVRIIFFSKRRVDLAFWEPDYINPGPWSLHAVGERLQPLSISLAHFLRKLCLFLVHDLGCTIVAEASDLRRYEVYSYLSVLYNIPVELRLSRWNTKRQHIKDRYGRRNHQ